MVTAEDIRRSIIESLLCFPTLGENYIDWHTENPNECGVTIMYKNQNQQFDILIRQK